MTTRRRAAAVRTAGARTTALVLAVSAFVAAPIAVGAASATSGSVPLVVSNYASDGLLARLDDLFGVGAGGNGLDFGTDSKVGEVDRVYTWRSDFLAGKTGASPVTLTNEWTATITIADKPVGVATIWINPENDAPDLADFTRGASLGSTFAALPADATLVHDTANSAWFTLTGDALVPLVPGDSGVTAETTVAAYQKALVAAAANPPVAPAPFNQGAANSIIVVALVLLAVIALVVLTGRRSQKARDAAAEATPTAAAPALAPPTPTTTPAKKPTPAQPKPTPAPAKTATAASKTPAATTKSSRAAAPKDSAGAAKPAQKTTPKPTPKTTPKSTAKAVAKPSAGASAAKRTPPKPPAAS